RPGQVHRRAWCAVDSPPGNLLTKGQVRSTHVPWPAPAPPPPPPPWGPPPSPPLLYLRTDAPAERAASRGCDRHSGGDDGAPEPSQRLSLSACCARASRPPEGRDGLPPREHGG